MKNKSNIKKYKRLSSFYDSLFGNSLFDSGREQSFSMLDWKDIEEILLIGAGTGSDLAFIPQDKKIQAIDLSSDMLALAKKKFPDQSFEMMNAEELLFDDDSFDLAVMHLVLSVVEDPKKALNEAVRVTKNGGKILVFDKFIESDTKVPFKRKLLNVFTSFFGTDINRRFCDIQNEKTSILKEEDSILNGEYKIYLLQVSK